jgi:signal transduction histidine kinase/phage shock protein PspC (stress-responsive transcriptional regulator)
VTSTTAPADPSVLHDDGWKLPRSADRIVAGVAGAYAARWRVEPTVVRAAVGVLTLAGGIGLALYGLGLVTTSAPDPNAPRRVAAASDHRRELAIAAGTLAILLVARWMGLWPGDAIMIPAILVAAAVALMWTPGRGSAERIPPALRVGAGVVLALAGVAALAGRTGGLSGIGRSVSAIAIALGGVAVIAAPAIGRLVAQLDQERTLRVREEERAKLAVHLHDSVLQSLVLIQRADDPRQMVGLARRQERELRAWLYGGHPLGEATTLTAAVEAMAAGIEVDHAIRLDAVTVGDQPLDEAARAFLGALREAATNAARHSGAGKVDVFVEVDDDVLVGYVRDTGVGFVPAQVAKDRHGLADSIIGRAERAGGKATVISRPGEGTEVEIRIPRSSR